MFTVSSNWLEEATYEQHLKFLWGLVEILEQESGPWASEIRACRLDNDPLRLAGLRIDHQSGSTAELIAARQCRALVEKWENLRSEIDRENAALKKFQEAEASCKEVNARFKASMVVGGKQIPPRVWRVLQNAKQEIHRCLGKVPKISEQKFAFGPGASTSVKAKASSARWKLESPLVCSKELIPGISHWLSEFPHWVEARRCYRDPYNGKPVELHRDIVPLLQRTLNALMADDESWTPMEITWDDGTVTEIVVTGGTEDRLIAKEVKNGELDYYGGSAASMDLTLCLLSRLEDHLDRVTVPVQYEPGKLQFVPKNYKTRRGIIVEPILNSMLQKGYGTYIRERLGRVGQNLNDQTRNQRLAREGSITGRLATIDLSSASDTLAKELVDYLLTDILGNYQWASLLGSLRTAQVDYKGDLIDLQKWSSMGNGYTFELESLIFWALIMGCCRYIGAPTAQVSIYGDDIICPVEWLQDPTKIDWNLFSDDLGALQPRSQMQELVLEVFSFCGFSVNLEKSFWDGPFRESCGADYYKGVDIRPFYMKKTMSGQALFAMHNFFVLDCRFDLAEYVLQFIPHDLQLWGPAGYGDGHLIGSYSLRVRKAWSQKGFEGGVFDTYALSNTKAKQSLQYGDALLPTYSIYATGPSHAFDGSVNASDHFVVRGHEGYQRMSIYTLAKGVFS